MANLSEKAIREAAYYIWQNAGCPSNTSTQDWNAAINQLSALSSKKSVKSSAAASKTSSCKTAALKKTTAKSNSKKSK